MTFAARPLRDYALIGDMRTAALVTSDGSIDWWCPPRFDAPAVFCRLLDARRGGFMSLRPEAGFTSTRSYVGDTNVLATRFEVLNGQAQVTDFLPITSGTPGEAASHRIVRRIEGLGGTCDLAVRFRPTFQYGRLMPACELVPGGVVARVPGETLALTCSESMRLRTEPDGSLAGTLRVKEGDRLWMQMTYGDRAERGACGRYDVDLETALEGTLQHWSEWAARIDYDGPYRALVLRSALTLKLLTYAPTGAVVAAPTTSLPECMGGGRNWDYRFTWLRDSAWTLDALMQLGQHDEAMSFWIWLERVALNDEGDLRIAYAVDGSHIGPEHELAHLSGYRGSRPIRVGNEAADQTQLDVYGELMDGLFTCSELMSSMRPIRAELRELVCRLADKAATRWREKGHGLWELRAAPRRFLSSLLYCWVALDRAIRLAERDEWGKPPGSWQQARGEIRRTILEQGYDSRVGSFTQALGSTALDAAVLLLPLTGLLPASDPRMRSTVATLTKALGRDGLILRYEDDDGLPGREGAFTACTFWLASNLALDGKIKEAREVFNKAAGHASDLGLLSEEVDPVSGELLGNYPQGFTHLALIRAALELESATHSVRGANRGSRQGSPSART